MKSVGIIGAVAALLPAAVVGCGSDDSCYGPTNSVEYVRQVKRMQPGVPNASYTPSRPLEWGQINFLHTTDTHGWLAGHLKEPNYGADWGDFVTFSRRMKQTAGNMGADLLIVDTGDLHDGAGLSDATTIDGTSSMPVFTEIDYDLLTIGNHELYVSDVAYQMFNDYATKWGDKYVNSNVKIRNPKTNAFETPGVTHRYFTTPKGIRIMAFGVLFDFTGNSNASQVTPAKNMVKEQWFKDAITSKDPVDLYLIFGHNPVNPAVSGATMKPVFDAIRAAHPTTPVSIFGGHTHIRDFAVYDEHSVGIESGRYCETLGWMSLSGFDSSNSGYHGIKNPHGVPNPSRTAVNGSSSPWKWSRRYLDWNRNTFIFHSRQHEETYDYHSGQRVTTGITDTRNQLRLGEVYGCAPQTWCMDCVPFDDPNNIFPGVMRPAISAVVINQTRADKARMVLANTGAVRFDLLKGPFTYDDNFVVSPFRDIFRYIKDVPFAKAKVLLDQLNKGPIAKRNDLASMRFPEDDCTNPAAGLLTRREMRQPRGTVLRQEIVTPGYTTKDAWGTDGDDSQHLGIPHFPIPGNYETRANFPKDGSDPATVDLIFFDFIEKNILSLLGAPYTEADVECYIDCHFSSQDYMIPYAKLAWSANKDNCPVGN